MESLAMWHIRFIIILRRQKQVDLCEFEDILNSIACSRTTKTAQQGLVLRGGEGEEVEKREEKNEEEKKEEARSWIVEFYESVIPKEDSEGKRDSVLLAIVNRWLFKVSAYRADRKPSKPLIWIQFPFL